MKQHVTSFILASTLLLLGASSPASGEKELIIRLQAEVLVLQRQLRDLQESFDKAQTQSGMAIQKLAESSESSVRSLTNIEESFRLSQTSQTNNSAGINSHLNKILEKLNANEQKIGGLTQQITSLQGTVEQYKLRLDRDKEERQQRERSQAEATPTITSAEQLYAYAYSLFNQSKYEQAIMYFRQYLNGYGQSEAADNALYWIAESQQMQGRQAEALKEFDALLTKYPRTDRAASATYKRGLLLLQLERRDEGVEALKNVIMQYPMSPEASQASQELTRLGENVTPANSPKNTGRTRGSKQPL